MFLSNNSPVSAFSVYKTNTKKKRKNKQTHRDSVPDPPSKKPKKTLVNVNNPDKIYVAKDKVFVNKKNKNKEQKIEGAKKEKISHGTTFNTLSTPISIKKTENKKKLLENAESIKNKAKTKLKRQKPSFNGTNEMEYNILNGENDSEEVPTLIPIDTTDYSSENNSSIAKCISELNKTDPSPEGLKLFKWLISPLKPSAFFDKYWEKEPVLVQRNSSSYYSDILTTERLDSIFREFPLYYTKNVDVVSYENGVKEVHNEEGRVVASGLYDYYSNGCSIRVLNPHTYDQKVHILLSTLQEYFGTMVGANIYLTPPGSQGFAPHYDDIEAFVIQLEGRKHWKLYKPR